MADYIATGREIKKFQHVPSPEWQDQIIYFILTDRFMDGDSTNNDQDEGEYKKGDGGFWNGGDFKGITQRIPYIKELGATAIWITPPVANQWRNPQKTGTGSHGYWARSFIEVDQHYGSLEDYQQLSASLHKNGMYLIQDVVVNHLGDFYTYQGPYDPEDVTKNFHLHDVPQPTQYPFMHNNVLDPRDREMAIYHFTPDLHDHSDSIQRLQYQFGDLDDLNTSNPLVRRTLRHSYTYWIKQVGVDGFRFDTPMLVEHDFWHDFLHSTSIDTPGIQPFAKSLGKDSFLDFGETGFFPFPYDDSAEKEVLRFLGTSDKPEMTSGLNFPLQGSIRRVFQQLGPTALLSYRLNSISELFPRPELLLNFIDNHDGARFLTQASKASYQQALLFIMTIPGIPVIYYGTEQEFLGMRQAMFKGGVGSPDRDHFDTSSAAFHFLKDLIDIRKNHQVLRRGELTVLQDSKSGPGVLAYMLEHIADTCFILLNTSEYEKLISTLATGLDRGTSLTSIFDLHGSEEVHVVNAEGKLTLKLAPKAGMILVPSGQQTTKIRNQELSILTRIPSVVRSPSLELSGSSKGLAEISILIDGDLGRSVLTNPNRSGDWMVDVALEYLTNGVHEVTAVSRDDSGAFTVSDPKRFELNLPTALIADLADPAEDDHGPKAAYSLPSHLSYGKQLDIRGVSVYSRGNDLQIDITMADITRMWLPPNGFDHVLINIYIDLPHKQGISELPFQNARMPQGGMWDYLISAGGFGTGTYSSNGASNSSQGTATGPAPFISVDENDNQISFQISSETMGYPTTLKGAYIYITTWGGAPANLMSLKPDPELWSFSGGTEEDVKIMDDTELIILD